MARRVKSPTSVDRSRGSPAKLPFPNVLPTVLNAPGEISILPTVITFASNRVMQVSRDRPMSLSRIRRLGLFIIGAR